MISMNYTISQLAEEFGLTTRTIRYYEELDLLNPGRSDNSRRVYSKKEYARLKLIVRGKRFGFSLEEIKEMIHLFDRDRSGKAQLERTIEYGNQKIEEVSDRIKELETMKQDLENLRDDFARRLEHMEREENKSEVIR
ncbi:MerR family transcriptional regulator [Bacillus sp. SCS-153A]|uniref:MerR family transcriptional regulator n=1 Tax=Rossellomorea sedimentorum TaxID=3115294 RepID=UPI003905A268